MGFETGPEKPKTEIDGVVDAVCGEHDCQIKKLVGHLQDGQTWMFTPVMASGEVDIKLFAQELSERLNYQNETHYVTVESRADTAGNYVKIEPISEESNIE